MKQFTVIIIIIFICGSRLKAQNLSEFETVQYIQNTFTNNDISIDIDGKIVNLGYEYFIEYENPIVTIISENFYKRAEMTSSTNSTTQKISFNINDVRIDTVPPIKMDISQWWSNNNKLFLECNICISVETQSYFMRFKGHNNGKKLYHREPSGSLRQNQAAKIIVSTPNSIVALRLRNAFKHLQNISGKGQSKPDPFDQIPNNSERVNGMTQSTSTVKLSTSQSNNSNSTVSVSLTYTNNQKKFTINYPKEWEVMNNAQAIVFLAPVNGNNFRNNFNVFVSNNTLTLDKMFQTTQQQIANSNAFVGYKLNEKEYVSISGINGIKTVSSYRLNGYAVRGIQYILKKTDNTVYTISFTVGESSYNSDRSLVENIIQSFKSL